MRIMGIRGVAPGPDTSKPHPENKIYPYLLRGLLIDKVNQVLKISGVLTSSAFSNASIQNVVSIVLDSSHDKTCMLMMQTSIYDF
jgi:hypothetical protein